MKFYSEITKKMYDSVEELDAAEKAVHVAEAEKATMKATVDTAFDKVVNADNEYRKVLHEYLEKYGSYSHCSSVVKTPDGMINKDCPVKTLDNIINEHPKWDDMDKSLRNLAKALCIF